MNQFWQGEHGMKKINKLTELLNQYKKQTDNNIYIAYDDTNNSSGGDCCQAYSNCCGSGNVKSDCCFDACCSYFCCGC